MLKFSISPEMLTIAQGLEVFSNGKDQIMRKGELRLNFGSKFLSYRTKQARSQGFLRAGEVSAN